MYLTLVREKQYKCELYFVSSLPGALLQTKLCAEVLGRITCYSPWCLLTTVWIFNLRQRGAVVRRDVWCVAGCM